MMHPTYPTLSAMVAAVTLEAERAARLPVDPREVERFAHRVLGEPQRSRPRIANYLPELAIKQVLALVNPRPRLG